MEINQFVKLLASQFEDSDIQNIDASTDFRKLETWDSLTAFSVQSMIEDEFNVTITQEELNASNTVSELLELIGSK